QSSGRLLPDHGLHCATPSGWFASRSRDRCPITCEPKRSALVNAPRPMTLSKASPPSSPNVRRNSGRTDRDVSASAAMSSLKGKTLFISGGSRGIGLAIALRAARDGANVTIAAKTAEPHPKLPGTIHTAADEIEKAGGKALPVMCDIRDEAQVAEAVARTVERFGGIDIC